MREAEGTLITVGTAGTMAPMLPFSGRGMDMDMVTGMVALSMVPSIHFCSVARARHPPHHLRKTSLRNSGSGNSLSQIVHRLLFHHERTRGPSASRTPAGLILSNSRSPH